MNKKENKKMRKITLEELNNVLLLHKKWLNNEKDGKIADLRSVDLKGVNLKGVNLGGADLKDAILGGAILEGANLEEATLEGANLEDANLKNAILKGANLEEANFRNAILEGANLESANLVCANLEGAILTDTNLKDASLYKANLFYAEVDNMLSIGNIGKYNRTIYYFYKADRVICGCFDNTLEQFQKAVEKQYAKDSNYYIAIDVFKRLRNTQEQVSDKE